VFDGDMRIAGIGQKEFTQIFPKSGWVEHDPEEIWETVLWAIKQALKEAKLQASEIAAIGITNQRETVVVWERESGKPIHNAIVWQDRRTASYCEKLKRQDLEKLFTRRTGLLLDPYFSGTKLSWMLANVKGARARAAKGELCFGTIDTFLIWRLTGGKSFVTDATNASRTLIYNIADNRWDEDLLEILRIPAAMLLLPVHAMRPDGLSRRNEGVSNGNGESLKKGTRCLRAPMAEVAGRDHRDFW
jgi:glycerol kinase